MVLTPPFLEKKMQMIMDHVGVSMETPSSSQLHRQQTPNSVGVRKSAYQIPARVAMEQSFYIYIDL